MKLQRGLVGLFTFIFSVFIAPVVSALTPRQVSYDIVQAFIDWFEPILIVVLGGESGSLFVFEKLLLFAVLMSVIYISLEKSKFFESEKGKSLIWLVTVIVSLLAVRFMNYEWIDNILLQYQIIGIVLTSILPFVIYFFFLHSFDSPALRKIGWVLFAVVYFALWSDVSNTGFYSTVYFWTGILSVALLFFDKTISRYFIEQSLRESERMNVTQQLAQLQQQLANVDSAPIEERDKERQKKVLRKRIKKLQKAYY